ncbi:FxsB family cyclophane-forming radical SAM/SPASM peptide maturase [Actinokineospora sp. NBRC 105648]|uniref:FxsB family cyclophane-forming radical SAM/SPASM peptide maturase n=1 Tax=Actinokineospora sp. NBRC 105648 TaxID=3032206 RepID=UPI0024A0C008|nr:FxsB family cyclophane-forming radical SAM/SPASM peptide maturase [Actinokineospora sp. NBRC 105648]GLZ41970.1 radical SAM protein [Actinokineospora sp. NBRC 105648]
MTPAFRQFVVKVHGRCDLACDYCYVFEMADQRWRGRVRAMSARTAAQVVSRIADHARAHGLAEVELVLHGGEPLLAGARFIGELAVDARARIPARTRITVQTNGVRLDRRFLDLFGRHDIRVGVSLDGAAPAHDRHRRGHHGEGSHDRVRTAVELLRAEYPELFAGLLCVIDLANDPVETYAALVEFRPPTVDFLLPHGTWTDPPPGRLPESSATPYADWLIAVFDHWYATPGKTTAVRLFDAAIGLWLGAGSAVEGLGTEPPPQLVIETDGSLERSDILAAAYSGAGATGLHVETDPFDAALAFGAPAPAARCRGCPVFEVCGGGQPAHRYRAGTGFANPSVYCPDLFRFTNHVRYRLAADLGGLA